MWLLTSPFRVARLCSVSLVCECHVGWSLRKMITKTSSNVILTDLILLPKLTTWHDDEFYVGWRTDWLIDTNRTKYIRLTTTFHLTLMMTSAQVVEKSVIITGNSTSQDYTHQNDQTILLHVTPGFKQFNESYFYSVWPQVAQAYVSRKNQRLIHERVTRCVTRC